VLVTVNWTPDDSKSAVTLLSWLTVIWQVPTPEHPPPDQPANCDPDAGVAVRETVSPVL